MLRCEELGKRFGRRWLFRGLNLDLGAGDCLVVLGSNGSGKSTLLKVLAGLIPASEGRCQRDPNVRQTLGYAALDQPVYPDLTVAEHLQLAADLRGCTPRTEELLAQVDLSHAQHTLGKHLSTGMRARLKLALAFQARPGTLLMDEPSVGLDESGKHILRTMISEALPTTAFVLATNDSLERDFATYEIVLEG